MKICRGLSISEKPRWGRIISLLKITEQVTELRSERYWAKCWEEMVGVDMTFGFLNLWKVRDERENQ